MVTATGTMILTLILNFYSIFERHFRNADTIGRGESCMILKLIININTYSRGTTSSQG